MHDLTEADLERVIPAFYARVRDDAEIGPLFNATIADWPHHLDRLVAFWSSVMLTSGRYKGNPMAAHIKHRAAITPQMFDRWLALWGQATAEIYEPDIAAALADDIKIALLRGLTGPLQAYAKQTETGFMMGLEYEIQFSLKVAH